VPRKIFVAGEILTAADVNSNLMDQAVMVFDDATARTTAIPSPIEGMVTYLKDVDGLFSYNGTAWVPAASGASLGAGTVLQVVQGIKTDPQFSSSVANGAFVAVSGLEAKITPRATSSKILVHYDVSGGGSSFGYSILLKRDGTGISLGGADGSRSQVTSGGVSGNDDRNYNVGAATVLDSPNTTSEVTYTIELHNDAAGSQNLSVNRTITDDNAAARPRGASRIVLMEVAG
jgi:hypothetical protein